MRPGFRRANTFPPGLIRATIHPRGRPGSRTSRANAGAMNIKEVAKLAKVSTATLSRTINGSDKVSARTAERVQKAIKELNFYRNTHARTLVSGRSRRLG